MDPCCALKYYPDIELCVSEMRGEEKAKEKQFQKEQDEDFGNGKIGRMRKQLWNLTENPETSKAALILGYCSLGLVIVSTITFVLGTFPGQKYFISPISSSYKRFIHDNTWQMTLETPLQYLHRRCNIAHFM